MKASSNETYSMTLISSNSKVKSNTRSFHVVIVSFNVQFCAIFFFLFGNRRSLRRSGVTIIDCLLTSQVWRIELQLGLNKMSWSYHSLQLQGYLVSSVRPINVSAPLEESENDRIQYSGRKLDLIDVVFGDWW